MSETFVVGLFEEAEERCALLTAVSNVRPREEQSSLVRISISLLSPQGMYGMPGPADTADLSAIEEAITSGLATDCTFAGRTSGNFLRQLIYFSPTRVPRIDGLLSEQRLRHPQRTFTPEMTHDQDHSAFDTFLKNARLGWNDFQVIQQLQRAGADLTQPRQVDYTLRFPTREAAERAVVGFDSDPWRSRIEKRDDEGWWPATITQVEIVRQDRIAHYSAMFRRHARIHGGVVDGWGASVHEATDEGPETRGGRRLFRRR